MQNSDIISRGIALFLIGTLLFATFFLIKPIIIPILLGLFFAYLFRPLFFRINKKVPKKSLAATLTLILFLLIVAVPILFLLPNLIKQTFASFLFVQGLNFTKMIQNILPQVFSADLARVISMNLDSILSKVLSSFMDQLTRFIVNIPNLILQAFIAIFTFFFAVRDSDKLKKYLSDLSPLTKPTEKKFLKEFRAITDAIIYGQLIIGILQGIAIGIGLFLLGGPSPLLLGAVGVLVSIIPILGAWIVWLPAAIYMMFSGNLIFGIVFAIYGFLGVSLIDNFLRPYFLSKNSNLPISIALIGSIGGLYAFGLVGLVLGPLILAYSLILLEFYKQGKLGELLRTPKSK